MITITWSLPTGGDSRHLVAGAPGLSALAARGDRPATLAYLAQVARGAEQLGFAAVRAPLGPAHEDPWLTAAMLVGSTERLKFLLPVRPSLISPVLAARMAATFQLHSGGRLRVEVADPAPEFVRVLRALWRGEEVTVDGAPAAMSRVPQPVPPLYVDDPAGDVLLTTGEPPPVLTPAPGRRAVRLHVITRDTSGEAWAAARRLLASRTFDVHNGHRASKLEVYPNLWAGLGETAGGVRLALIGNHAEVAARIEEYHTLGVDEFVLSGHPHLEEAYWFGEGVLPQLHRLGVWRHPAAPVLVTQP